MAIIKPTVREFGSSFGSYGGAYLKDYQAPEPNSNDVLKSTEKDVAEFKSFQQSIKDFIFARLGHPTVRVELTDFQIETCIDEAISKLDYHCPAWMTQFAVIQTTVGESIYELPPEVVNNLTNVWYKKNIFQTNAVPGSLEYDFTIMFFTNTGLFNNHNVGEYVLMQQYLKQIRKILGQGNSWEVINGKYLHLSPVPNGEEDVILEFRGIDSNTILPAYRNWIQRYALAVSKEILGRVRSKYDTLPGPGGGSKLDGQILLQESEREKEKLLEELTSEIENPPLFDFW